MQSLKIDKKIEQEVETMILLGKQVSAIKSRYPACWNILKKEFDLSDFIGRDFVPDDIENVKVSLYAEIVRANNKARELKKQKIAKKLNN